MLQQKNSQINYEHIPFSINTDRYLVNMIPNQTQSSKIHTPFPYYAENLTQRCVQSHLQTNHQSQGTSNKFFPLIPLQNNQYMDNELQKTLNAIYMILQYQNRLIFELAERNQQAIQKTLQIADEIQILKKSHKKLEKQSTSESQNYTKIPIQRTIREDITGDDLINLLYDTKNDFQYFLVIDDQFPIDKIHYRQKNFKIKLNLVDKNGQIFQNSNKIPISLALYTVENPPKLIQSNNCGNKIIKGPTQQNLIEGLCVFEKIQIKQVTSHFRNGVLFLIAYPQKPSFELNQKTNFIDYRRIRPMIIQKLVIKAKKDKNQNIIKQQLKCHKIKNKKLESEEDGTTFQKKN